MARKLFADLPSSSEVAQGVNSSARIEELWPVGTIVSRVQDFVESITDSDLYIRLTEIRDTISPTTSRAWSLLSSTCWVVSTSFLVIGMSF
mmetsp:Transcript_1606/g.2867  ORF Transcript_1606/g.2867 Transcript_1606/m.2867 type:complete len:91 (-) Transcript_1606:55-327(-)